jgi:transcriptional antiterminator RfaH
MPLLPQEPYLHPEGLLNGPGPTPGADDPRWWVLHTRPRSEKALARGFLARSVAFFLPLYHRQWSNRGRLFASHLPLFPGYVFLHGDERARLHALETNLVVQVLPVADQPELHADLARVLHLMRTDAPLAPEQRLQPGDPVEVIAGPLAGLEGKVLRRGRQLRFVIEVHLLRQGVSAEVEPWMIRPLGRPRPGADNGDRVAGRR